MARASNIQLVGQLMLWPMESVMSYKHFASAKRCPAYFHHHAVRTLGASLKKLKSYLSVEIQDAVIQFFGPLLFTYVLSIVQVLLKAAVFTSTYSMYIN